MRLFLICSFCAVLLGCGDIVEFQCGTQAKGEAKFAVQFWQPRDGCWKSFGYFPDKESAEETLKVFQDGAGIKEFRQGRLKIENGLATIVSPTALYRDVSINLKQMRIASMENR